MVVTPLEWNFRVSFLRMEMKTDTTMKIKYDVSGMKDSETTDNETVTILELEGHLIKNGCNRSTRVLVVISGVLEETGVSNRISELTNDSNL